MNGFLIVARFIEDDVPVGLFFTFAAAKRFAERWTVNDCPAILADGFNFAGSDEGFAGVFILEFRDGEPVSCSEAKTRSCVFPCPQCHGESVHVPVWKENWCYCERCRIRWWAGHGILSNPYLDQETDETVRDKLASLQQYTLHGPDGDPRAATK